MVKPFDDLLADEPTGSLDAENKNIVIESLIDLNNQGKTIIVVSHDKDFLKYSKRSLLIENRKIEEMY